MRVAYRVKRVDTKEDIAGVVNLGLIIVVNGDDLWHRSKPLLIYGLNTVENFIRKWNNLTSFIERNGTTLEYYSVEIPEPNITEGTLHPEFDIAIDRNCIPYGLKGRLNVRLNVKGVLETNVKISNEPGGPQQKSLLKLYEDIYGNPFNGFVDVTGGEHAGERYRVENGKRV